jgi:hypothetical protein
MDQEPLSNVNVPAGIHPTHPTRFVEMREEAFQMPDQRVLDRLGRSPE